MPGIMKISPPRRVGQHVLEARRSSPRCRRWPSPPADQPRPGLPRHRRPARGARGRRRRHPRRAQPVPAGPGIPELRAAIAATSTGSTASTSTPTPRSSSPPAPPRRSPPPCSRCASRATRSSRSSRTTTRTPRASPWRAPRRRRHAAPAGLRLDVDDSCGRRHARTRLLLLNSPHNPTGKVFDAGRARAIAAVAVEHDLLAVTDEVYEHLVFDGAARPAGDVPRHGRADGHHLVGGKTFSFTGWKVGWACGPAARHGGAHGQAVPHLRERGPVPAGHRRRARLPDEYFTGLAATSAQARPAVRRARGRRLRGVPPAGHLLRHRRHPPARPRRRHGVLPRAARALRRGRRAQRRCSTTTAAGPATCSCASPSASAPRCSTRRSAPGRAGRRRAS